MKTNGSDRESTEGECDEIAIVRNCGVAILGIAFMILVKIESCMNDVYTEEIPPKETELA